MEKLYDLGYQSIKSSILLTNLAKKLGAVVCDIRFSPHSRDMQWEALELGRKLGALYHPIPDLGNRNYKGDQIEIANLDYGLSIVHNILVKHPVILMCGCWDRNTCHRKVVADRFVERIGIASIPLAYTDVRNILKEDEPPSYKQEGLF
jgi:uncharacterized protein (DUF488 family)